MNGKVKGVPLRLELGHKELESDTVVLVRRDTRKNNGCPQRILTTAQKLLETIQTSLFEKAKKIPRRKYARCNSYDEFKKDYGNHARIYQSILVRRCGL